MNNADFVASVCQDLRNDLIAGRAKLELVEALQGSQLWARLVEPTEGDCCECETVTDERDPDDDSVWLCEDCLQDGYDELNEMLRLDYRSRVRDLL